MFYRAPKSKYRIRALERGGAVEALNSMWKLPTAFKSFKELLEALKSFQTL